VAAVFADDLHTGYMDPLSALPTTPGEVAESMHLRVEYQTVRRLPDSTRATSRWILFTVRTHVDAVDAFDAPTAAALLAAMEHTSAPDLAYKSLGSESLRTAVAAFLKGRAQDEGLQAGAGVNEPDADATDAAAATATDAPSAASYSESGDIDTNSTDIQRINYAVATGATVMPGGGGRCPFFRGSTPRVTTASIEDQG
jgi:hypothetical protein